MILIDEIYHHFVSATSSYRSFLDYPLDDSRVVVARTFSKIYGLAGLRLGYSVSSEAASSLSALRLQNGVTIVSAKAAIAALEDSAYVWMAAKRNADDRQEFMNQVNAGMLRAIDSHANFVLLNPLRPVSEVFLHLGKNDVHVAPSIPEMERYIRVSLGTPAEMREFWLSCPPLARRCTAGIVLQHSWLRWWPCDEQCMVSQHCIAASGVDMAKRSNAYVAKATVITASRIGLIGLIYNQGRRVPN